MLIKPGFTRIRCFMMTGITKIYAPMTFCASLGFLLTNFFMSSFFPAFWMWELHSMTSNAKLFFPMTNETGFFILFCLLTMFFNPTSIMISWFQIKVWCVAAVAISRSFFAIMTSHTMRHQKIVRIYNILLPSNIKFIFFRMSYPIMTDWTMNVIFEMNQMIYFNTGLRRCFSISWIMAL